jgi:hypothetical protein
MSENPSTLSQQLANRVKRFCLDNNFTQKKIAHELSIDQGQFSAFLGGTASRGFGQELKPVRSRSSSFHRFGRIAKILAKALSFATKFCESSMGGKRTTRTRFAELRIFAT